GAERHERVGMLEETPDVILRGLADHPVALGIEEQVPAILPDRLVGMHTGTIVPEERLGHKGRDHTEFPCHVLDDIFVHHAIVRHFDQRTIPHIYLILARGCHFMVVHFYGNSCLNHPVDDATPYILERVVWRYREIAFLVAGFVPEVGLFVPARVPDTLNRI